MMWLRSLWRRVHAVARAEAINREIAEEMQFHIDMRTEENIRRGMSPEEARKDAEVRLGNSTRLKEQGYDVRGGRWLESFWQDFRYGARVLQKNPLSTLIVILTLALGIGANTAIFSVINAVLLRPLPFTEPERLVTLWNVNPKAGGDGFPVSYPDFYDWRAQQHSFERLAAFHQRSLTLTGAGEAARLNGATVTADLFPLLGITPQLGRSFTSDEEKAGNDAVILSDGLWHRRFNGDSGIIGRVISIDGRGHTIVGVMPAGFDFPLDAEPVELWTCTALDDEEAGGWMTRTRDHHCLEILGRLRPSVTLRAAQADLERITAALEAQYPGINSGLGVLAVPYFKRVVGYVSRVLLLLFGAVACILLIACSNASNLLLAQAAGRQREMMVRSVLGAGRRRLIQQMLTESVLLSLLGGAGGVLLAFGGTKMLLRFIPEGLPRIGESTIDLRVLSFSLLVMVLTGVLFGLAPALQGAKANLVSGLKEGGRGGTESRRARRLRDALVMAQVMMTFVLLISAGLLLTSFRHLLEVKPGFDAQHLLSFHVSLPWTKYREFDRIESFYQQLTARVAALPDVTSVSATSALPFSGESGAVGVAVEGEPTDPHDPFPYISEFRIVRSGYFRTLGVEILQGRDFDARDTLRGKQVVIVNESFARQHFSNQNPLGRRIKVTVGIDERGSLWREIIGVVKDVKSADLSQASSAECYIAHSQIPFGTLTLVVRTKVEPHSLINGVRREAQALDPDVPIYAVHTMEEYLSASMARPRFNTVLLSLFAGTALLLTAIGLYGVLAWSVVQRTPELGIRLALGAPTRSVLRLVIGQGMRPVLLGLAAGLLAALPLTRLVESYLFGVRAHDPATFGVIAGLLTLVGLLACYLPAQRAAKVDPMVVLRYE